ncbi:hypothetical protein HPB48_015611 [Haemaphysalis longicornis]|uniref:GMP reductase n=1 Tax=Haemaphysalis longicornis TaxID=44386 RepID=A0A9J6FHS7_HAELO|nr:hypothetical protein HPB48_015611 [Haemaphysalis longicornis]
MPHIDYDVKLDFKDVLLRPKRSTLRSRVEVDLNRTFKFRNSKATYTGVPIIAANMDTVGTFEMAEVLAKNSMFTTIHKHYSVEQWKEFYARKPGIFEAGNVVTGEMVEELLLSGADIIKVGIGPGSVCTTRKKTGVGYPQLSADGGCTCPGDVSKAFGAGADFVMLGGMLAGHDESGGEVIEKDGKKYKMFYGMSSATAMEKYHGGVAEYRASEGKTVQVPYRGDVQATVLDILGGLRSACTYTGAGRLKELTRRTTFIRVTQQLNEVFCKEP